jgi:phage tail sheath protein FI
VDGLVDRYILQQASRVNFSDAVAITFGKETSLDIPSLSSGTYFFRVRAEGLLQPDDSRDVGTWSNVLSLKIGSKPEWVVQSASLTSARELFKVQQGLLRLCKARGDLFSILSLPSTYRENEALAHVRRIAGSFSTDRVLSFGALYHPWLYQTHPSGLGQYSPPEGAITGMIASCSLTRGAWVAPANKSLARVLALESETAANRRLELQEGGLNIIRREPSGFMPLCANTLNFDEDLRLISVRRLLILLLRLALREGAKYVFEPNSSAFRRQVQRGFENVLADLYSRGAFAGSTPDQAYQVVINETNNPIQSVDAGRLVVDLRVAPSVPLSFLTVRLVQTGERIFQVEEI